MQLHAGFTFDDAAAIVPYLARLGVSHVYCSPILQAAPGSTHGYDVVDHQRLNDELGGASGWERLTRALAEHDLAVVLDIVPNHMALAGAANRWWWDVLENGPSSRYASYFDIDWGPSDGPVGPSVLAPVLGDHYGRVLEARGFHLARVGGSFTVRYEEHELPLSLRSLEDVLQRAADRTGSAELAALVKSLADLPAGRDPAGADPLGSIRQSLRTLTAGSAELAEAIDLELARAESDLDVLDRLLGQQAYRLAHWRTASEELDYRRFFDVTSLVGLRAEDPAVFEDTHRVVLDLVRAGDVTGLRIDHIDGLRDPFAYLDRLAAAAPEVTLTVEKILAADEALPRPWPVVGTSGYDFVSRVTDLFVDGGGLADLCSELAALTGDHRSFAEVAGEAKVHVMDHELAAETDRLTEVLVRVCRARRRHRDHTRRELRDVLTAVAGAMAVYRTYVVPGRPTRPEDRRRITDAVDEVREQRRDLDAELLDLIEGILCLDEAGEAEEELAVRFQQLSAPAMAKGVEDTAFYRYVPLLARNEVGGQPGPLGDAAEAFHAHNRRIASDWPGTMLTLSTHDTKRSADVRARLAALSEIPAAWTEAVRTWMEHNASHRRDGWPDPVTELVLYQSIVGAWPIEPDRVEATMLKSIKEAKVHTSWRQPDEAYEAAVLSFVRAVMTHAGFLDLVAAFLDEHQLVRFGRLTSLAQVTLLLTSPGVPDLYQGDELWNLSLVDPDNRRPVDFERRESLLDRLAGAATSTGVDPASPEVSKLWLVHRLLDHRRRRPEAHEGGYRPLVTTGPSAEHAVTFAREALLVVIVPRLVLTLDRVGWGDTAVELPEGFWRSVLPTTTDSSHTGTVPVADLLGPLPVAVLERTST